jgi:hypothetical protein
MISLWKLCETVIEAGIGFILIIVFTFNKRININDLCMTASETNLSILKAEIVLKETKY